ncbi:MAG: TPM domain-containing protein [Planctomycetes bacterium]|nr:TPM domain-containing protein [Planctomycetota bacterium]
MLAILLAWVALLAPQSVPQNDGWVTDRAKLLSPGEERALEQELDEYRAKTGHELALLTVPSLDGGSIERLALETARAWKMGREGVSAAALLVVAKDERELRIEVGRGLEGELTDLESGTIIRKVIVPRFKGGDYYAGVHAGLLAMMESIQPGSGGPRAAEAARQPPQVGRLLIAFVVIGVLGLFILARVLSLRRSRPHAMGRQLASQAAFDVLRVLAIVASSGRGGGHGRGGGGFGGFGGGGGFSGGGASGRW